MSIPKIDVISSFKDLTSTVYGYAEDYWQYAIAGGVVLVIFLIYVLVIR